MGMESRSVRITRSAAMQVEGNWRGAANLELLLNDQHPSARLERSITLHTKDSPASEVVSIDARNTANFRTTSYCSRQDLENGTVRRRLINYYREMLHHIPLWQHVMKLTPESDVKLEGEEEDSGVGAMSGTETAQSVGTFRAVGILTQAQDSVGDTEYLPWEFFVIHDVQDDDSYAAPLSALARDTPKRAFSLLFHGSSSATGEGAADVSQQQQAAGEAYEDRQTGAAGEGQRLALYTKMTAPFTGVYPGMAVGIIGDPFQRDCRGVLTGLLVREFLLPSRPTLPWHSSRPLVPVSPPLPPVASRIHFCSGPFPRRDIRALLCTATRQALHRGADLLIIGGPLIQPFEDFEKEILPSLGMTFADALNSFVDSLEDVLEEYYATRPRVPHMKIVLVSHREDVTQVPVLPTTMYAMEDTPDILFRSNPCRIAVNGVHVSVCNQDVVGVMRDVMVERWPSAEGSLRRVVEAVVQSRWYTPIVSLPAMHVDLKHLETLRMDVVPAQNEITAMGRDAAAKEKAKVDACSNWDRFISLESAEPGVKAEDLKRVKTESSVEAHLELTSEKMPHIMFLPSTRPRFAFVTHRGLRRGASVVDECSLDDAASATGVLVLNQEVWSRRSASKYDMRVMEVTIPDSNLAMHRGATPANGVSAGVLHIFSAAS